MAIDRAEVRRIARLARLALDEPTVAAFAQQLQRILEYAGTLGELESEPVPRGSQLPANPQRLRDDVEQPGLSAAEALANAPDTGSGHFRVPQVLGE